MSADPGHQRLLGGILLLVASCPGDRDRRPPGGRPLYRVEEAILLVGDGRRARDGRGLADGDSDRDHSHPPHPPREVALVHDERDSGERSFTDVPLLDVIDRASLPLVRRRT